MGLTWNMLRLEVEGSLSKGIKGAGCGGTESDSGASLCLLTTELEFLPSSLHSQQVQLDVLSP